MDYEHDDRRAADVPGANGAEESGLPAGHEPHHADSSSPRSPEVRAFDLDAGSGLGPSGLTGSGQADDLFDAMFLSGGMRPPAFAAVDHDLGFPPPQAPDLASAFLAALDAIDDRRFVTPVPEEPPVAHVAPAEPAPAEPVIGLPAVGEPVYELRPQSQVELESLEAEERSESVDETAAASVPVSVEGAEPLPWDATGRVPVAGLLTTGEADAIGERDAIGEAGAIGEPEAESDVEEFAHVESAEPIEEIEESEYFAAGHVDEEEEVDEREDEDDEELTMLSTAELASAFDDDDEEAEASVAAPVDVAGADVDDDVASVDPAAYASADVDVAGAVDSDDADGDGADSNGADAYGLDAFSADAYSEAGVEIDAAVTAGFAAEAEAEADADADDDVDAEAEALAALALAEAEAELDAVVAAEPMLDASPSDEDFELEPAIGMEPMDAAPMTFDGPDAFAPAPVAVAEPEPEAESDELEDLQDFVVFSLGDMRCVVPIRNVVEVGRIPDAAPVPNAPVWLHGLGNLRGQVLSLIDLRALFGVGRIKPSAGRMVVLRGDADDISAGVMVDQVHQIVALSPSRFKEAPAELSLPDRSTGFVWGACDYGNFTMVGLDVDGVLGVEMTEETV
jgi:chemotaxis signal transduction protein